MRSKFMIAALAAMLPSLLSAAGDTNPAITAVYPTGAFAPADVLTNSARWDASADKKVLNVKTDFGAVGDGNANDSAAFIAMFNFLYDRLKAADGLDGNQNGSNCEEPAAQWILYVPNGTYKVTETLTHTRTLWAFYRGVRLIGQSRSGTILKVPNNTGYFDGSGGAKPVLAFDHVTQDFNNWQGHNMLKNITIDVGEGNPGAIGVDFFSANTGRIDNVTIKSASATNYQGAIGLHLRIGIVHGYFSNLTIDGFDVGIKMVPYHMCNPTIEHVTLRNQKLAAIQALDGGASFRDVDSNQSRSDSGADATGILLANDAGTAQGGAHVIIIDSSLVSTRVGGTSQPAINIAGTSDTDVNSGHLFARGIDVAGYTIGVKKGGVNKITGDIIQYATSGSTGPSMALPVESVPFVPSETTLANWKSPDDYFATHGGAGNGTTDDTAAAQAALNSGATVVYFPMQKYKITGMLTVPTSVKRIELMATEFVGTAPTAYFDVNASDLTTPLLIQDLNDSVTHKLVRLSAERTLILDSNRMSAVVNNHAAVQRVYVNNANKFLKGGLNLANMRAWCRFVDTEDKSQPNWIVQGGGVMWVLGFKCEGATVNFKVQGGGFLEVLGGVINQANGSEAEWDNFNAAAFPLNAAMINDNGHLSFTACTGGLSDTVYSEPRRFLYLVGNKQGTGAPTMSLATDFAIRTATNPNRPNIRVVGLHNSFTGSLVPRAPVFSSDPIAKPDATSGTAYTGQSIAGNASDTNGGTLTFARVSGPTWLTVATNGALSGTPADGDFGLNTWTVKVTDSDGYSSTGTLQIDVYVVKTFLSVAAEDGYVEESTETSNVGGVINASGSGTAAIRGGDQGLDRQFKSVVSFDTSSLPDGATVTWAQLQLKVAQAPTGTSPYTWGGTCVVDIKNGAFGTGAALEAGDFQAAASAGNVVSGGMPNAALNAWSSGVLTTGTLTHVNKTGKTQLRVSFTTDDNDNAAPDFVGWYSSESAGNEPKLSIKYH